MRQAHLADRCHDEGFHASLGAVAVLLAEPWIDDILHRNNATRQVRLREHRPGQTASSQKARSFSQSRLQGLCRQWRLLLV